MDKQRVCLYIRFATSAQISPEISSQEDELKSFCKDNNLKITDIYRVFASGSNLPPFLNQILCDAENKKFDMLLCTSISRLGRNMNNVIDFCKRLRKTGCSLYCLQERISLDNLLDLDLFSLLLDHAPPEGTSEGFTQSM